MDKQNFNVNKLRVASPCPVGWETMTGNERVRRCHSCELNIYNISEMTKTEIESLIVNREGRLCIRLYKRGDGTVLTKDCPIRFRAYQKKAARFAGAALATILGLFTVSLGQKANEKSVDDSKVKIVRTSNLGTILTGTITDTAGAIIPNAEIKLYKKGNKKSIKIKSDDNGSYFFKSLSPGFYKLEIKFGGFKTFKITEIEVRNNEENRLDITLEPKQINVTVGIYAEEPLFDTTSSSFTTKITRKMIEKLPH